MRPLFHGHSEQEEKVYGLIFKILLWAGILLGVLFLLAFSIPALLIHDDSEAKADAAVVLFGPHYDARVHEAGELYAQGRIKAIVLNGDRRSAKVVRLLGPSFQRPCPWEANYVAILTAQGVPAVAVHSFSIPDVYDSRGEALELARRIQPLGFESLMVVTDQYHTARSRRIWSNTVGDRYAIYSHGSSLEGDDPDRWWQRASEIKRVLVEFGGFLFAFIA